MQQALIQDEQMKILFKDEQELWRCRGILGMFQVSFQGARSTSLHIYWNVFDWTALCEMRTTPRGAVQLDFVPYLTTEAFLCSFRHFVAHRQG